MTEEFAFHNGHYGSREDVVFLINGIPVLVIECKNADKDEAIARVNRPYENEQAEMVKLHGFVIDFIGIFDKLEKALAFDSDEVNAIVKDLKLLKVLFQNKMERA